MISVGVVLALWYSLVCWIEMLKEIFKVFCSFRFVKQIIEQLQHSPPNLLPGDGITSLNPNEIYECSTIFCWLSFQLSKSRYVDSYLLLVVLLLHLGIWANEFPLSPLLCLCFSWKMLWSLGEKHQAPAKNEAMFNNNDATKICRIVSYWVVL